MSVKLFTEGAVDTEGNCSCHVSPTVTEIPFVTQNHS